MSEHPVGSPESLQENATSQILHALGRSDTEVDLKLADLDSVELAILFVALEDYGIDAPPDVFTSLVSLADVATFCTIALSRQEREINDRGSQADPGGRVLHLRNVEYGDYEFLYRLLAQDGPTNLTGFRSDLLSPETLSACLWDGVLVQKILVDGSGERLGLISCYKAELQHGRAHLRAMVAPGFHRLGWPLKGIRHFINELFANWNLRKLYIQVPGHHHASPLKSFLDSPATVLEARLRDHLRTPEGYVDLLVYGIWRDSWNSWTERTTRST